MATTSLYGTPGGHNPVRSAQVRSWRTAGLDWQQIRKRIGTQNIDAWLSGGRPPSGGGAPAAAPAAPPSYDYSHDPALVAAQTNAASSIAHGQSELTDTQKRILLALGSPELGASVLGSDPTVAAMSADPVTSTSTLARIAYAARAARQGTTGQMNTQNLFYSSAHGKALQELTRAQQVEEADAIQAARDQLAEALSGFTGTQLAANQSVTDANAAAAGAATDEALTYGYGSQPAAAGNPHNPVRSAKLRALRNKGKTWNQIKQILGVNNIDAWLAGG